jgi:hypothetical protein
MAPTRAQEGKPGLEGRAIQRGLLAGLLAWVFPGAGHWFVGARVRGAVFCSLVLGSLALGTAFDGNLALVDPRTPFLSRLEVVANLAVGPWDPLLRFAFYGTPVYVNSEDAFTPPPPATRQAIERRRERTFRTWSSYGQMYLFSAGLMNLLLIFDAWDIAIGRKE